jgi:hypothetical protein
MPAQLAKQEEKKRILTNNLIKRHFQQMQKAVPMYREYRVGELPDIQISYKDVLLPLMALVRKD